MKVLFSFCITALLFLTIVSAGDPHGSTADEPNGNNHRGIITLESLLREMTDRTFLASWPAREYRLWQASSYDRRSAAKDGEGWFANSDWSNYAGQETIQGRVEYVLLDVEGPGAITRFWTAGHPNQENHLRFYMDGAETPFWESDHTGALIGQNRMVGYPLSHRSVDSDTLNMNPGAQPGHNLYAPIPFGKHLKITSDKVKGDAGTGFWYQINYRKYDKGVSVQSFDAEEHGRYAGAFREANRTLIDYMQLRAEQVIMPGERKTHKTSFSLVPQSSQEIRLQGPGAIRRLLLSLHAHDMDAAMANTWLVIHFDGNRTVEVPAGFFFGCGDQLVRTGDWYRKVEEDGTMAAFWVMPYQSSSVITLLNRGGETIEGTLEAAVGDWNWDTRSLYFHSAFKGQDTIPAKTTSDYNYLAIKNQKGIYVGDVLQVYKTGRGWWGEGDEKIYIDGSTFPDHFGTGTEDYYGYAWGHPETFSNIFTSQPIAVGNRSKEEGITVNSRVRSLDAIPFGTSLVFDMEAWNLYGDRVMYAVCCFWYGR